MKIFIDLLAKSSHGAAVYGKIVKLRSGAEKPQL